MVGSLFGAGVIQLVSMSYFNQQKQMVLLLLRSLCALGGTYCVVEQKKNLKLDPKLKRRKTLHSNGNFQHENSALCSSDHLKALKFT